MKDEVLLQYLKRACAGKNHLRSGRSLQNALRLSEISFRRKPFSGQENTVQDIVFDPVIKI